MTDYDEAIKALVDQRWSDDQANYLSWLVETGRRNEETLPNREPAQFAHHELSPDLAKAIT